VSDSGNDRHPCAREAVLPALATGGRCVQVSVSPRDCGRTTGGRRVDPCPVRDGASRLDDSPVGLLRQGCETS